MSTEEEMHNALLAIHSRLGTLEGKVNLVARAERDAIVQELEEVVKRNPLVGQIYLLLDGRRTQREVLDELTRHGIKTSQPTVSRRMEAMAKEYGIADETGTSGYAVYRKNRAMEDVLNLSKRVRTWLADKQKPVPEVRARRARKRQR